MAYFDTQCCALKRTLDLNPNGGGGGGLNQDIHREIGCHFLQEPPRDLKILDFFKNAVKPRVKESF